MILPEIVATIGDLDKDNETDLIDDLVEQGVKYFRFNLSKYREIEELKICADYINKAYDKLKPNIRIMLDVPYPGKKPRIYFNKNEMPVYKNDILYITSDIKISRTNNQTIYIDIKSVGHILKKGARIIYSDGECELFIEEIINDNTIKTRVCNDAIICNSKSLSFNYVTRNMEMSNDYLDIIKSIPADSIAFSFISSKEDIIEISKNFSDIEIISKIESENGINNIEDISRYSNIMLGRGDLILNSNIYNLYNYQNKTIQTCKKFNKKIYIATGILTSLVDNVIPNQADIIDLSSMFLSQPDFIILNFPVIIKNNKAALNTIQNVFKCLSN